MRSCRYPDRAVTLAGQLQLRRALPYPLFKVLPGLIKRHAGLHPLRHVAQGQAPALELAARIKDAGGLLGQPDKRAVQTANAKIHGGDVPLMSAFHGPPPLRQILGSDDPRKEIPVAPCILRRIPGHAQAGGGNVAQRTVAFHPDFQIIGKVGHCAIHAEQGPLAGAQTRYGETRLHAGRMKQKRPRGKPVRFHLVTAQMRTGGTTAPENQSSYSPARSG